MSDWQPIQLASQSYEARARVAARHRLVNMYAEPNPKGARWPFTLYSTPGLKPWVTVGNGPIRGVRRMNAALFVVSGQDLWRVDRNGLQTLIGEVVGVAPVRVTDNGTNLNIITETFAYWASDTAMGMLPIYDFIDVSYQDGFSIFAKRGSQQFFVSGEDDLTTIDGADFSSADALPDLLVGCISDHREVRLFKQRSTEIWINSGGINFPFSRAPGGFVEIGLVATGSLAKADNRVFWLGQGEDGAKSIYASVGYQAQKVSTPAQDAQIAEVADPSSAEAFVYSQNGHTFYCLNFATLSLAFDVTTGLWHERKTYGEQRWRAQCYAAFDGQHVVGDFDTGQLYHIDLETYSDNGVVNPREFPSVVVDSGGRRIAFDELALRADTGVGAPHDAENEEPRISCEWSDDGGNTWSSPRIAPLGKLGQYDAQPKITRLGSAVSRVFRFKLREPVRITAMGLDCRMGAL